MWPSSFRIKTTDMHNIDGSEIRRADNFLRMQLGAYGGLGGRTAQLRCSHRDVG
jgi:hypothetical protein